MTVVRSWDPSTPNLRFTPEETRESLSVKVNDLRVPAGLHWHRIANLQDGIICNDTPEGVTGGVVQFVRTQPRLASSVGVRQRRLQYGRFLIESGCTFKIIREVLAHVPGTLTDTMVALIVGRPERVDWLRQFAPYTRSTKTGSTPSSVAGAGASRRWSSAHAVHSQPWTERALEQWDALPVLARLHRPVSVPLTRPDTGERLKREALTAQLAAAWKTASAGLRPAPARLFYDGGLNATPLAELTRRWAPRRVRWTCWTRGKADLTQRLGDTGAASPFVGIALATMATTSTATAAW